MSSVQRYCETLSAGWVGKWCCHWKIGIAGGREFSINPGFGCGELPPISALSEIWKRCQQVTCAVHWGPEEPSRLCVQLRSASWNKASKQHEGWKLPPWCFGYWWIGADSQQQQLVAVSARLPGSQCHRNDVAST